MKRQMLTLDRETLKLYFLTTLLDLQEGEQPKELRGELTSQNGAEEDEDFIDTSRKSKLGKDGSTKAKHRYHKQRVTKIEQDMRMSQKRVIILGGEWILAKPVGGRRNQSTWKEKGKDKEFDEWKEQRKVAAKITKNLSKRKLEIPKCSEAGTIQRTPVPIAKALLLETQTMGTGSIPVAKALLLETQTMGTGSIPVNYFDDNSDSEEEQDEIEAQMCQRIQQLIIELQDIRKSLPTVAKFIKQKKQQAEAMTVEVPHIKYDEVLVVQVHYKNKKQWEPLSMVILDGGAGVNINGEHMKEKMGITNFKSAPFRVRMADQRIVQPSGLLENLHIKVGFEKFKTIADIDLASVLLDKQKAEKQRQQFSKNFFEVMKESDEESNKQRSSTSTANNEEVVSSSEQMYEYCSNDEVDNNPTAKVRTDKELFQQYLAAAGEKWEQVVKLLVQETFEMEEVWEKKEILEKMEVGEKRVVRQEE
ncbi:hypothetical protein L7F22_059191 [Adiantum nelumboides]|nr:hypothetical protein [Adiantum nelumboides]